MATVKYRIKNTQKNPTPIYIRFRSGKEHDYEIITGLETYKTAWSEAKQQLKLSNDTTGNYDEVNTKLRELKNYIHNEFNKAQANGVAINKVWLEKACQSFFNRAVGKNMDDKSLYFIPYVEWYIEKVPDELNPKTNKKRSIRTIQDYQTTLKKLRHYEEVKKLRLKHSEVGKDFHKEFIKYCGEYHGNNLKTIGGELANIRLFLRQAELEGYPVNQDHKKGLLFSTNNETHDIALTLEDIEKITNHDFTGNERLDNARDWFVIGIWTGLRVSDLLKLTPDVIKDDFFQLKNKKTGIFVVIPIHKDVKAVLDKRGGKFPRRISDQKFNDYIKEVAKAAGLTEVIQGAKKVEAQVKGYGDKPSTTYRKELGKYHKYELVSSHICRRTFATLHYGKLDTLTIMNITGHKTEKQFLEYVKITPTKHAEIMWEFWNRMNIGNEQ